MNHVIYRDYIANRYSFIYCSLATRVLLLLLLFARPLRIYGALKIWTGIRVAQQIAHQTRDRKVASLNPGRSGGKFLLQT